MFMFPLVDMGNVDGDKYIMIECMCFEIMQRFNPICLYLSFYLYLYLDILFCETPHNIEYGE